eukprot:3767230-Pyramimonas_sp.AAC.1
MLPSRVPGAGGVPGGRAAGVGGERERRERQRLLGPGPEPGGPRVSGVAAAAAERSTQESNAPRAAAALRPRARRHPARAVSAPPATVRDCNQRCPSS